MSNVIDRVRDIITPSLQDMGYAIVRLQLSGKQRITLSMMIERLDETPVTLDDCVRVSRHASVLLEVDDPIPSAYHLEVSSPGLDRPLLTPKDFGRFVGHRIRLQTHHLYGGRKKFQGILTAAHDDGIAVDVDMPDASTLTVTYDEIAKANLDPEF